MIVLDLVKQTEKKPRESLIGDCYRQGIQIINENIAEDTKIKYCALDFQGYLSLNTMAPPCRQSLMGT